MEPTARDPLVVHATGVRPLRLPASARLRILLRRRLGPRPVPRRETLAVWTRRELGLRALEAFVAPQVRAAYGAAAEQVGAADAWPALLARTARHGATDPARRPLAPEAGGCADLPELARALGATGDPLAADDAGALPRADRVDVRLRFGGVRAASLGGARGRPLLVGRTSGLRVHRLDVEVEAHGAWVAAWLGGVLDPDVLALEDAVLVRIVEADLSRLLRAPVVAAEAHVARRPGAVLVPTPGLRARWTGHRARLEGRVPGAWPLPTGPWSG